MRRLLLLALSALAASASANPFSPAASGMLANGLRVILLPDPSLPVVSSTVLVGAGSEREDEATSGATHLLEHLLFNGTRSMTQEQLYETADLHGLYLNAATRERGTILIGLSPPDELATMLRVQAEMLFFSTIPEDKFEKEKLIVGEEIAKDRAQPDDVLWLHRARAVYGPSPCRFPILGSPSTIEAMGRQTLVEYYRRLYVPNNMTLLLIGAFPWPATWETLRDTFGRAPAAGVEPPTACPFAPHSAAFDTVETPSRAPSVSFTFAGPGPKDLAFPSFFLASRLVPEALARLRDPAASSWDASLHIGAAESRLMLSATAPHADSCGAVAARIGDLVARALTVDDAAIRRAAWSWQQEAARWGERPHMLAVMAYDLLTSMGWDGMASLWDSLASLNSAAWHLDVGPYLNATPRSTLFELTREGSPSYAGLDPVPGVAPHAPQGLSPVLRVFDEQMPPRWSLAPDATELRHDIGDTLPSGLVIWVRSEPGLDLAGMHVLFRQRGALEPEGKEGVAELFHRIIGAGPTGTNEEDFAQRLADLGALLQVTDNPFLPFDDYYYSSRWGYLRLTTPAESLEAAAALLAEALGSPRPDSAILQRERSAVMAALAREGRSPGKAAARKLWERLLPGDPRSRSPLGTPAAVALLRDEDIISFARDYVVGGNIIVTVSTPLDGDTALARLKRIFAAIPQGRPPSFPPRSLASEAWRLEDSLGVGQGHLLMALAVPASIEVHPTAEILAALLDRRMGLVLREQHGLAYSLGAQVTFEDGVALLVASVGTRPERIQEAATRLRELLSDLTATASADSVQRRAAAMSLEQRLRLRNLTRVGRAFSMGMDLMHDRPPAPWGALRATRSVTSEGLASLASRLLPDSAAVVLVR